MKIKLLGTFFALALLAVSCGNADKLSNESLAGSWNLVQIENKILQDTVVVPPGSVVYTFTAGGDFTATSILDTNTGSYTLNGSEITLMTDGSSSITVFEVTSFSASAMVWETDTIKATLNK